VYLSPLTKQNNNTTPTTPRRRQGTHNVEVPGTCQYRHPKNHDARLTAFGEQQCEALAAKSADVVGNSQMVVTSPLTRCVQTALGSFPTLAAELEVPFVAHESVRETVNFMCDSHRSVAILAAEYPRVDWSHFPADHDRIWAKYEAAVPEGYDGHRESGDLVSVADRGRAFFEWLSGRKETEVAVSSHSAFQRCLFSFGQDDGGVPVAPPQFLSGFGAAGGDEAEDANTRVVDYGEDEVFEVFMRGEWDNCELRTFLVAY
jgi:broad specificity phosphatase PhoE